MEKKLHKSLSERLAENWAETLSERTQLGEIDRLKVKLGFEVLLINASKGVIIYGLSLLRGSFFLTAITHVSFNFLKKTSFGLHAKNSFNCTLTSLLIFLVLPIFLEGVIISLGIFLVISFLCFLAFFLYAPADTEKNPLYGRKNREKLRRETVARLIILSIIVIGLRIPLVKTMAALGMIAQVATILPITYKLLNRGYKNYEKT